MECADTESCLRKLLNAPLAQNEIEMLASHLTVGETYFFREQRQFEVLGQHILAGLIASGQQSERRIRIWSAGCCTGEEPYSIAITLDRLLPDSHGWDITILATDLNPHFLQKARRGVYQDWSFRATPSWMGYLTQQQGDELAAGKHFRHSLERLRSFAPDDTVPESEGLTARQLAEVIQPMVIQGAMS